MKIKTALFGVLIIASVLGIIAIVSSYMLTNNLVYNDAYMNSKATINGLLNTFDAELSTWMNEQVTAAKQSGQLSLWLQIGSLALFFAFGVAAIFFVLRNCDVNRSNGRNGNRELNDYLTDSER